MGLFSKKPRQRSWEEVCSHLSELMTESRRMFFNAIVKKLESSGKSTRNTTLEGTGDLALTAYQLELVSALVGELDYVDEDKREEFDSLLLEHICGTRVDDYMAYIHRYYVQKGEAHVKLLNDVIRYITDEPLIDVSLVADLQNRERIFSSDARVLTAAAFGDAKLAEQLSAKTKSALAKVNRY